MQRSVKVPRWIAAGPGRDGGSDLRLPGGRHRRGTRTAPGYLSSSGDNLCTVITLGRGDGLACRVRARRARDATPATRAVATISFLLMGMMMMGSGQEANTLSKGQVLM